MKLEIVPTTLAYLTSNFNVLFLPVSIVSYTHEQEEEDVSPAVE